jgi:hypothetical protein
MPRLSLVVSALVLAFPSYALAAGAYVHKDPKPVEASVVPKLPTLPTVTLDESFNGCGGRRVRDAKTGQCRGPGDIAH